LDDGLGRFLSAAGDFGFLEISTEKIGNCLDNKEWTENLRTVNDSKYYLEISKIGRGSKVKKVSQSVPQESSPITKTTKIQAIS
jgi:hypothetical protein